MVHKWWSEDKFVGVNHSLSWGMQAPEPGPFAFCHSDLKNKIYEPQRPSLKSIIDSELLGMGVGR